MKSADYLDAVKTRLRLPSDYALKRVLGVTTQQISFYRTGKGQFGDDVCLRVAEILDIPPGRVLADVAAERAKSEAVREVWRRLSAVAAGSACAVILSAAAGDTNASQVSRLSAGGSVVANKHSAQLRRRRPGASRRAGRRATAAARMMAGPRLPVDAPCSPPLPSAPATWPSLSTP